MTADEKIRQIEEAMELVIQAQEMVDDVVDYLDIEPNYRAYGRYGFDRLLGNGNPYDDSLDTIIRSIENEK